MRWGQRESASSIPAIFSFRVCLSPAPRCVNFLSYPFLLYVLDSQQKDADEEEEEEGKK